MSSTLKPSKFLKSSQELELTRSFTKLLQTPMSLHLDRSLTEKPYLSHSGSVAHLDSPNKKRPGKKVTWGGHEVMDVHQ